MTALNVVPAHFPVVKFPLMKIRKDVAGRVPKLPLFPALLMPGLFPGSKLPLIKN